MAKQSKLHERLNIYLANQQVMSMKIHNLHWYVKGASFFTLHAKLDDLYEATNKVVDEVAERMLALGLSPVASMKKALSLTAVKELDDKPISSKETAMKLKTDIEYWIKDTKEIITLAEDEDDVVTADLFTGYLGEYQKLNWMINSYLDQKA